MPDYRIYPSLLDSFQRLVDYELVADEPWNIVSEAAHKSGEYLDKEVGDYKLSPDEMYRKLECELINSINRCPRDPSEAADKGTAFNEIVDCIIEHRGCNRDDCNIHSEPVGTGKVIIAEINDFRFIFDENLCREVANYFSGALTQQLVSAILPTKYGDVELYGYVDEWKHDVIYDIKTTSNYSFGNYERKWQRHVYPYCAINSGMATEVSEFEYTVVQLAKTSPITGTMYREAYTFDLQASTIALTRHCEHFISWLLNHKELITDQRIFGGENAPGYVGTPILI